MSDTTPARPDTHLGSDLGHSGVYPECVTRWRTVTDPASVSVLADIIFAAVSSAYTNGRPPTPDNRRDEEAALP